MKLQAVFFLLLRSHLLLLWTLKLVEMEEKKAVSKSLNISFLTLVCYFCSEGYSLTVCFHGVESWEMFLITAAKINQFMNEGLKGCNKSFTTFLFYLYILSSVCNFYPQFIVVFRYSSLCIKSHYSTKSVLGLKIDFIVLASLEFFISFFFFILFFYFCKLFLMFQMNKSILFCFILWFFFWIKLMGPYEIIIEGPHFISQLLSIHHSRLSSLLTRLLICLLSGFIVRLMILQ